MIGRFVPVAGAVRRSWRGTGLDGDVRAMGLMEIVGVAAVVGNWAELPIKA